MFIWTQVCIVQQNGPLEQESRLQCYICYKRSDTYPQESMIHIICCLRIVGHLSVSLSIWDTKPSNNYSTDCRQYFLHLGLQAAEGYFVL